MSSLFSNVQENFNIFNTFGILFQKRETLEVSNVTELKEEFRPPEWLSDCIPRYFVVGLQCFYANGMCHRMRGILQI